MSRRLLRKWGGTCPFARPFARPAVSVLVGGALFGLFGFPSDGHAQWSGAHPFTTHCPVRAAGDGSASGFDIPESCYFGAVYAHVFQDAIGLLAASGGPTPAGPNTAGSRLAGSPRWVVDAGVGFASYTLPDLGDAAAPLTERRRVLLAPRVTVVAGIYEGLSPSPTVGGLGAMDVVAEARLLPVPTLGDGSGRAGVVGFGARLGILRESFTLPGVTIILMHRRVGTIEYGTPEPPLPVIEVRPRVTSLRAVVGKDMLTVGLSAGVQRDRIRGNGAVRVPETSSFLDRTWAVESGYHPIDVDRTTWFVGVNRTWVVAQMTAELGWSREPAGVSEERGWTSRGAGSALTGGLSFRVTY